MIKDVIIEGGGGGGVSSDDVTAGKAQVLAGYTALTSDSNDEPITGTLALSNVLVAAGGTIATYDGTVT